MNKDDIDQLCDRLLNIADEFEHINEMKHPLLKASIIREAIDVIEVLYNQQYKKQTLDSNLCIIKD